MACFREWLPSAGLLPYTLTFSSKSGEEKKNVGNMHAHTVVCCGSGGVLTTRVQSVMEFCCREVTFGSHFRAWTG